MKVYKWISVTDKLPDLDKSDDWNFSHGHSIQCLCDTEEFGVRKGYYSSSSYHWVVDGVYSGKDVVVLNWMPYPTAPERK